MVDPYCTRTRLYCSSCIVARYAVLLAFFLAGGPGFYAAVEEYARPGVVIDMDGKGGEYELDHGDTVVLRLPENPAAGYEWAVESCDGGALSANDPGVLTTREPPGAGVWRIFTFQARSPGVTSLRFTLKRHGEPKKPAIDHFAVTLQVR